MMFCVQTGAPTAYQLRLDLNEGVVDGDGNCKYIICVGTAAAAEEWKAIIEPAHTTEYTIFAVEQVKRRKEWHY